MNKIEEKYYIAWLLNVKGVGNKTLSKLLSYFGSAENIFKSKYESLNNIRGINKNVIHNIVENKSEDKVKQILNSLEKYNIDLLQKTDVDYPENLKHIYDPPMILYKKGIIDHEDANAIAIVGSRKASAYGKYVTHELAKELAKRNITIVSGMAYGIDTIAHQTALDHGGRTIAVLGCGLDICYPKTNYNLMKNIQNNGAIISEYPVGIQPVAGNFPARNRIISGLSKGVIIIEASLKSGSLITANFALEQGRDVFAVPGNINSTGSCGTNKLIQEGAKLVTCIEDVLEELNIKISTKNDDIEVDLSETELEIYNAILEKQPLHVEELMKGYKWNMNEINGIITILELKGIIQRFPGNIFFAKKI
ncbi:DNA-protecting protein DprA [Lutibacter sp. B2]|nr:DNA-protecting protein DprA [Lutibacter sp. B2]